eukprot:129833_1
MYFGFYSNKMTTPGENYTNNDINQFETNINKCLTQQTNTNSTDISITCIKPALILYDEPLEYDFNKSIVIDTDSDWESDDEFIPPSNRNDDIKTNYSNHSRNRSNGIHKASIDHFRIRSVSIYNHRDIIIRKELGLNPNPNKWMEKRKCIENELIETEKKK